MSTRPYHHRDLQETLVRVAVEVIEERGPSDMTLREVARRAGVTHPAAAYHFGDRIGLLTAVAAEGYRMLAAELEATRATTKSFLEMGVAYVRFALAHRGHFVVMYNADFVRMDDRELKDARATTAELLYGSRDANREQIVGGVAAWSIVHGLATLWLNGVLPPAVGDDPEALAREVASRLRVSARAEGAPSRRRTPRA